MAAKSRILILSVCIVLVLSVGIPIISGQENGTPTDTPDSGNDDIEDGVIQDCTTITDPGYYEMANLVESDSDTGPCIVIETGGVTIDGQGGIFQGNRHSATGIKINTGYTDSDIRISDITFRYWGETVIDQTGPHLTVENADFHRNTQAIHSEESRGTELTDVEITNSHDTAFTGSRQGEVRMHNVEVSGGDGGAFATIDGVDLRVTGSSFKHLDRSAFSLGHSTGAELSNVEITDNGGSGVFIGGSSMNSDVEIEDSTIVDNQAHGVDVRYGRNAEVDITDTLIDDNRGKAIAGPEENGQGYGIKLDGIDLAGGIVVSGERQTVTIGTHGAPDHETDALNFSGPADADIETTFSTGTAEGALWAQTSDGWQQRGTYDSGTFTEVIGPGTWAASGRSRSTPEPTPDPTPTVTSEPTPPPTDTQPNPGSNAATPTETPSNNEPITRTREPPTSTAASSPTDTTAETATDTSMPMKTDTDVGTTERSEEASLGDDGSRLQWYGIAVAIILLLTTLTASLVSWE